jgi:hypothetical protein
MDANFPKLIFFGRCTLGTVDIDLLCTGKPFEIQGLQPWSPCM